MRAVETPKLSLTVQFGVESAKTPTRAQIRKWAKAALAQNAEVTIRLVGQKEGRVLNRDYRGKDYGTNVLTFVYEPMTDDPMADDVNLQGDLVLCVPVVAKEAREQRKSLEAHYAHLVVHGMLHLQGYDHESEDDARIMEALESHIVRSMGYPDPYRTA